MKRTLLPIVFLFLSMMVYAQEKGEPSGDHTPTVTIDGLLYKLSEATNTAMVANANTWNGELVIPEEVNYEGKSYTVDRIEWLAFISCKTLTKVRIPKTIVDIKHYAGYEDCKNPFEGCTSLESIEVDEANPNMCSVDGVLFNKDTTWLFCYPAGLRSETYTIPDGVTRLGGNAFAYNPYLLSVQMPNSVTRMSFGIFSNCKSLKSVQLSENIKYIDAYAFESCDNLRFLDIPESVTGFAESVFRWSPLETILIRGTFPAGLRYDTFYFLDEERTVIYCYPSEIDKFKKVFKGTVLPLGDWTGIYYRPFVEDGKVWKIGSTINRDDLVKMVEYYYFDGDTIIDGKTCKQMMRQRYVNPEYSDYSAVMQFPLLSYVGAWYEEDKKVYLYNASSKQFMLKYDFSVDTNDTIVIRDYYYVIGPRQTGGIKGFKGVYRDVMMPGDEKQNTIYNTTWLEGVGGIEGPINNVYYGKEYHAQFLMACTVGDEVIYLNDEYEDGATPEEMNARKRRFDFTHTIKTQPKARNRNSAEAEQSLYGEYNDLQLGINLNPLEDAYQVRITDETGNAVYEKAVNAGNIVGLNIDISSYAKGRYTVTVENSLETFTGEFEVQTTGIEVVRNKKEETSRYIYNLQGQRLSTLQKGLNIVNGRKIYVK